MCFNMQTNYRHGKDPIENKLIYKPFLSVNHSFYCLQEGDMIHTADRKTIKVQICDCETKENTIYYLSIKTLFLR